MSTSYIRSDGGQSFLKSISQVVFIIHLVQGVANNNPGLLTRLRLNV